MKIYTNSFYVFSLVTCLMVIAGSLLFFQPFWGLMDDASLAYILVPRLDQGGVFKESWRYAISDISWGMFRPIYPLMAYLIYKPGLIFAPWASFVINAVFSILLIWWMARFWAKLLKMNWREVLLINACFYYQYDLLWHPSLQEKIVILAGLMILTSAAWCPRRILFPVFVAMTLLGFLTKASFVIYFGAAFLILTGRLSGELYAKRFFTFCALAFAASVGFLAILALGKIASQGGYTTEHYSAANIWPNLASAHSVIFLAPLFLGAVMFIRCWQATLRAPQFFAPWVGVALFLATFLPWAISGYIQAVIGPLVSVLVCQLITFFVPRLEWRRAIFSFACVLAVVVCSFRVPTMFIRLHDLGTIVNNRLAFGSETLNIPCSEGAGSVRLFLGASGTLHPEVKFHEALPVDVQGVWLYDSRMCPLTQPILNIPGCNSEHLYQPLWDGSYHLVRVRCGAG